MPADVRATQGRDGKIRMARKGVETAWLACAIGNQRAARFYEKRDWRRVGNMINRLETATTGIFPLEVWRYEKSVGGLADQLAPDVEYGGETE